MALPAGIMRVSATFFVFSGYEPLLDLEDSSFGACTGGVSS